MKHKKRLPRFSLRRLVTFLGVIAGMIVYIIPVFAFTPITGGYSCQLTARSFHNMSGGSGTTIDDDGWSNFDGGGFNDGVNCNRQFFFSEYTGPGTYISLQFQYAGPESYGIHLPTDRHDVYITNRTTGVSYPYFVVVDTAFGLATIDTLPTAYTADSGELIISYYQHGATPGMDSPDIRGRILLHSPIQKLWIDAPPICSGFTGSVYNFLVHAYPDFSSVMFQTDYYTSHPGFGGEYCTDPLQEFVLSFSDTGTFDSLHHGAWTASTSIGVSTNYVLDNTSSYYVTGSNYAASVGAGHDDMNHYWIKNSDNTDPTDLAYYLTGAGVGKTPVINITVNDGINGYSAFAPIIIESSALPATPSINDTATIASGLIPGPANAIGIPAPSYDIYNYVVHGTET